MCFICCDIIRNIMFLSLRIKYVKFIWTTRRNWTTLSRTQSKFAYDIVSRFPQILFTTATFSFHFNSLVSLLFLFSSLVSFAFCVFINKNIYCNTHRLCGRVTDKKFSPARFPKTRLLFFSLFPWYISWQKVQLYYK